MLFRCESTDKQQFASIRSVESKMMGVWIFLALSLQRWTVRPP